MRSHTSSRFDFSWEHEVSGKSTINENQAKATAAERTPITDDAATAPYPAASPPAPATAAGRTPITDDAAAAPYPTASPPAPATAPTPAVTSGAVPTDWRNAKALPTATFPIVDCTPAAIEPAATPPVVNPAPAMRRGGPTVQATTTAAGMRSPLK